jgi:hypothetical protein
LHIVRSRVPENTRSPVAKAVRNQAIAAGMLPLFGTKLAEQTLDEQRTEPVEILDRPTFRFPVA